MRILRVKEKNSISDLSSIIVWLVNLERKHPCTTAMLISYDFVFEHILSQHSFEDENKQMFRSKLCFCPNKQKYQIYEHG